MSEIFLDLNVNPSLITALEKQNITVPTDVQTKAIPCAMQKRDLMVQSKTGTGKTLAYLLPLFEKINFLNKETQAIVLVPTHELAIQILRQIERLAQNSEFKVTGIPIIGNVNITRQIEKLREKPHIIVGSAGRILELIKKKKISAHTVKTIILDEADKLLDDNNRATILAVIKSTLKERQIMAFSATISQKAISYGKEMMQEPEIIKSEEQISIPTTIEHMYFLAEQPRDKIEIIRKLVRILNPKKGLVFLNQSYDLEVFLGKLKHHGFNAEAIHGTNKKLDRKKAVDDFRTGKLQLLIASDIAARGLDIDGITHVFNVSMPEDPQDYLHRVGRTGRAGNVGVAVSIIATHELPLVEVYEKSLKIKIEAKGMYEGNIVEAKERPKSIRTK